MLTVTQAAAFLGISARRVRALIAEGRIKAVTVTPRMYMVREPVVISPPKTRSALRDTQKRELLSIATAYKLVSSDDFII
jgi:excisionase family DNA binding protein